MDVVYELFQIASRFAYRVLAEVARLGQPGKGLPLLAGWGFVDELPDYGKAVSERSSHDAFRLFLIGFHLFYVEPRDCGNPRNGTFSFQWRTIRLLFPFYDPVKLSH